MSDKDYVCETSQCNKIRCEKSYFYCEEHFNEKCRAIQIKFDNETKENKEWLVKQLLKNKKEKL